MKSISSFAEDLILQEVKDIKEGKELPPSLKSITPPDNTVDISKIEVPDSFMQQVLGEEYTPSKKVTQLKETSSPEEDFDYTEVQRIVETCATVLEDVEKVVSEIKKVFSILEMTGVGGLGVGPAQGLGKKGKKKAAKILRKRLRY